MPSRDKEKERERKRLAKPHWPSKGRWEKNNPEKHRASKEKSQWKVRHGITPEQFYERINAQGCRCALCGEPLEPPAAKGNRAAVLDHDHVTGERRGVLHRQCNLGLGCFQDNPVRLGQAKRYLEEVARRPYSR